MKLSAKLFIFFILISSSFLSSFTLTQNDCEELKEKSNLSLGDAIEYFDLIRDDGEKINSSCLHNKISTIFIFSQPCHLCEKNKKIWRRIHALTHKKANTYGIVMDDTSRMIDFSKEMKFKFRLYCPENRDRFKKALKLNSKSAQTILIEDKKVIYSKSGVLEMDDYLKIIKLIKGDKK